MSIPPRAPARVLRSTEDLCEGVGIPFSEEQLEAITAPLRPAVIIAGAGSGKTTVMAARVVWLVGTGQVQPQEVLGLTFTRKAANELAQRVRQSLLAAGVVDPEAPEDEGEEVVMTYDSFAARLVSEHGLRIGVEREATMLTGASRHRIAGRVVARAEGPFAELSRLRPASVTQKVLQLDQELSSHLVTPEQVREHAREYLDHLAQAPTTRTGAPYADVLKAAATARERLEVLGLVEDYRALKADLGLVEFADQMAVAARLASRVPAVSLALRQQFRVVLLDEYQDTSSAQAQLLQDLFSGPRPALGLGHAVTAVGDPFQAIYGWRGAAASNILQFRDDFPAEDGPADAYALTVNRRSGQSILDAANTVVAPLAEDPLMQQAGQAAVQLRAPAGRGPGQVAAACFETWPEEVDWLAQQVVDEGHARTDPAGQPQWSSIAVLVRRNADIGPIFTALVDRDVPVEIVGLGGLLTLPEVADVVATLTVLHDLTANPEAVRLLSGPRWRIGPRDLAVLGRRATELARQATGGRPGGDLQADLAAAVADLDPTERVCLLDAVADPGQAPLSAQARERLVAFDAELAGLRRHAGEPVTELVRRVVRVLGLDVELEATRELSAAGRRSQLAIFLEAVAGYTAVDADATLGGLLAWFAAELEHGSGLDQATASEQNSVKLLTVHRSKGLEWEVVHLPGLVEGVFPSVTVGDNWVKNSAVIPAELRGDAEGIPQLADASNAAFKDFEAELKQAQVRSEDRLAYVAMTRARERLVASSHQWRPGTTRPRKASRYLGPVLEQAELQDRVLAQAPPLAEANPTAEEQTAAAWPVATDPDARERRLTAAELVEAARGRLRRGEAPPVLALGLDEQAEVDGWDAEIDHLLAEARRADEPVVEVAMPSSLSASALMAATRDPDHFATALVRPMPRPVSAAATLGTRFHDWVERRFGAATLVDPEDWPAQEVAESDLALHRLIRAFENGPYARRHPIAVEVPFVLALGESLLRGRIDAVYAGTDERHDFQVVDWKTANRPSDPTQLAIYRLAWSQARGVPPERVDAVFYHVLSGEVERPAVLADEQALRLLAEADLPGGREPEPDLRLPRD